MSRRVDPANPSLVTHHLAGDPESRPAKAIPGDIGSPGTRPPNRLIMSNEPPIVGRIAGSSGAVPPAYPPRPPASDEPPAPAAEPPSSGEPQAGTGRSWKFWRRRRHESDQDHHTPDPAASEDGEPMMSAAAVAAAVRALGPDPSMSPPAAEPPEPPRDADPSMAAPVEPAPTEATEDQAPDAAPEPTAELQPEPEPEPEPEPVAELQPEPEPEVVAELEPAGGLEMADELELDAQLEPDAAEAQADAAVEEPSVEEPAVDGEPEPIDGHAPVAEAEAELEPEPEPEPEPQVVATVAKAEPEALAEPAEQAVADLPAAAELEAEPESTTKESAAPAAAVTSPAPVTAPATTEAAPRKRSDRRVLIGGGVALLALAVGIGTAIAVNSGSSRPSTRPTSAPAVPTSASQISTAQSAASTAPTTSTESATIAGAQAWLTANIPRNQRISADPNLVDALRSAGYAAAHVQPGFPGAPDWHADSLIISTPQTRAQAASVPDLNAELAASIPVAVFGTGTQSVEARMVFGTSDPDILSVQAQRQDDATNRRLAGDALLRNPHVTIAPAWKTLVATGGLDLRASVVIGLIAAHAHVTVAAVVVDPAETAAGTPARIVRVAIPPSVLPGILPTLRAGYRPAQISSPTQNNTQLTELSWGVTLTPQPTLS
jgi:hypothetical protein